MSLGYLKIYIPQLQLKKKNKYKIFPEACVLYTLSLTADILGSSENLEGKMKLEE